MVCDVLALRRVPARFYGVFMSVNPVFAALTGLVILRQSLGLADWLAITAIVTVNAVTAGGAASVPRGTSGGAARVPRGRPLPLTESRIIVDSVKDCRRHHVRPGDRRSRDHRSHPGPGDPGPRV
jgi:hypothetical protein